MTTSYSEGPRFEFHPQDRLFEILLSVPYRIQRRFLDWNTSHVAKRAHWTERCGPVVSTLDLHSSFNNGSYATVSRHSIFYSHYTENT
jgi:hypothetical protein